MKRSSVRPSVCAIIRQEQRRAAGLLLSAVRAGDISRQRRAPMQQQRRRSTAFSSKCGQCHVDGRGRRLNTDLLQSDFPYEYCH